jgi:hypothetical protein
MQSSSVSFIIISFYVVSFLAQLVHLQLAIVDFLVIVDGKPPVGVIILISGMTIRVGIHDFRFLKVITFFV